MGDDAAEARRVIWEGLTPPYGTESTERAATSVRLPVDLLDRLNALAKARMVGRNLLVTAAIERFLNEMETEQ